MSSIALLVETIYNPAMSSTPGSEQTTTRSSLSQPAQRQDGPVAAEGAEPSAAHTAHWYVLEPPSGPTVHGVCKSCGAERDWLTAGVDDNRFGRDPLPSSNQGVYAVGDAWMRKAR